MLCYEKENRINTLIWLLQKLQGITSQISYWFELRAIANSSFTLRNCQHRPLKAEFFVICCTMNNSLLNDTCLPWKTRLGSPNHSVQIPVTRTLRTLKLYGKSLSLQELLFLNSENHHPVQRMQVKEGVSASACHFNTPKHFCPFSITHSSARGWSQSGMGIALLTRYRQRGVRRTF